MNLFQLPPVNVIKGIIFVYLLLACVNIAVLFLKRAKPQKNFTELTNRIKTFWVIVLLLGVSFCLPRHLVIVFWGLISFLALKEYFTIINTRQADRRVVFWAYLSIPMQYYCIAKGWYGMFTILIPVYFLLFLPFRMVMLGETKGFLRAVGTLQWGVMLMVYCVVYIAALDMLDPARNPAGGPQGLIFCLLFLNQFNDVAQFFWGKTCGKHKIIPLISPNKTIEGFLGGVLTTTLFALFLGPYLTPVDLKGAIFLGLIVSVTGFIGDVTISALKRDLGIKDTGQLLPGHGGILDRIDSLLFTAPLYFHFLRFFYYS